jgi:hypothetical protein
VKFVAQYGTLDAKFQEVRVHNKPVIQAHNRAVRGMRILAMFRKDIDALAEDLSNLLHRVFRGNGYAVDAERIVRGNGGDLGDAALLCHFDGGSVRPHQKLASREAARIVADRDGYRRLVGPRGQQQKTEQDQNAHDASLLTRLSHQHHTDADWRIKAGRPEECGRAKSGRKRQHYQ